MDSGLFKKLVMYYCEKKWRACSEFVDKGVYQDPTDITFTVGDENPFRGALIIANGDTLANKLVNDELIEKEVLGEFKPVETIDDFISALEAHKKDDGAFVYDGVNKTMAFGGLIKQNSERLRTVRYSFEEVLPADFMAYDRSKPASKRGAKTDVAIKVPMAYDSNESNVESYAIKTSAYTPLGMGLVTHFTKDGLKEDFFLAYVPGLKNNPKKHSIYFDEEKEVVGIHRTYKKENNKVVVDKVRIVPKSEIFPESSDGNSSKYAFLYRRAS